MIMRKSTFKSDVATAHRPAARAGTGLAILLLVMWSSPAQAYIGPGAGLSALGTVAALLGAVLLLLVGFIWYPVKRLVRRRREAESRKQG